MSLWGWVLLACLLAFATKLLGHLLPRRWLEAPRVQTVMTAMTIGLLAGLIASNTLTHGRSIVIDARILALLAAGVALRCRAPFIVVVAVGAVTAAVARLAGLP